MVILAKVWRKIIAYFIKSSNKLAKMILHFCSSTSAVQWLWKIFLPDAAVPALTIG